MWIEKDGLLIRTPNNNEPQFIFYSKVACFGWFNTNIHEVYNIISKKYIYIILFFYLI